jgi:hypothetical protein
MAVLHPQDVATEHRTAQFAVTLDAVLRFAEFPEPLSDEVVRRVPKLLTNNRLSP